MSVTSLIPAIVDQAIVQSTVATRAPKATKRQQVAVAAKKTKKSWFVSAEAVRRVGVHATMEQRSESDIVDELLCGLNRWAMPAQNTRGSKAMQATADTQEDRQDGEAA
jgi:hypothetical protein